MPDSATPWTVAHQAPLPMGFPKQEYWSWLPCLPPRNLPDAATEPMSPASPAMAGRFFTTEPPGKPKQSHRYKEKLGGYQRGEGWGNRIGEGDKEVQNFSYKMSHRYEMHSVGKVINNYVISLETDGK